MSQFGHIASKWMRVALSVGGILYSQNLCADGFHLTITRSNSAPVITWTNVNAATVLESATSPNGSWSQMPEAASPVVVNPTNSARFYRLYLACVTAPAGIVSWWPGNGNVNDIISADNGALLGSATFANGKVGQAFSFDGNSGCAVIPASDSLNPTGPFSVEFWVRASSVQFYPQVLLVDKSHGWTDSAGWLFQTFPNQGTVGFGFGLGGPTVVNFPLVATATSVFDDQWHHLAGVWTGSELQIYLDGGLQGTLAETNSPVNNSRGVEFGRSWGGGTPTRYFHGLIDEVSYYNTALSSNQVNAIYTAGAAGKCNP